MADTAAETKSVALDDAKVSMVDFIAAREKGNTVTVDLPVASETLEEQESAGAQAEEGSEDGAEHPGSKEGKSQAESEEEPLTAAQQAALDKRIKRELRKHGEEFEARVTAELEKRAKPAEGKEPAKETAAKAADDPEPELSEYPTREEIKKHAEWVRRQSMRDHAFARAQELQQAKMSEVLTAAVKAYPDWNDVVAKVDASVLKPAAQQIVATLGNSRDVIYHLAKQLGEDGAKTAFTTLSEAEQINEVVQLSASLLPSGSKDAPKERKPAPPEPITPVGGGASRSSVDLGKADMSTYMKARDSGRTR